MGFSLLLKIIMPLEGHADGYDTTLSSPPLGGCVICIGGVRTAETTRGPASVPAVESCSSSGGRKEYFLFSQ